MPVTVVAVGADRGSRRRQSRVCTGGSSVCMTLSDQVTVHACRCAGGNEYCQNVTAFLQRLGEGARCEVG